MSDPPLTRYILDGHTPVKCPDLKEWAEWYETADRQVSMTGNDNIWVSTIFLGLNHRFISEGPPILFETIIFGGEHDNKGCRSETWEEAELIHKAFCNLAFPQLAKENGNAAT